MMGTGTIITITSVLIALGSLVTAIVTLARNGKKETKSEVKENVEIHASLQSQISVLKTSLDNRDMMMGQQLSSIDSGVRDLRADNRGMRNEITKLRDELRDEIKEIHDEAKHGVELAEAAHRRLDRLGADPDILVTKIKKGTE